MSLQNNKEDKYSVLMSVYKNDNPQFLKSSIESMLNQTIIPEQYVIVEDGPVDGETEAVIRHYEESYPELFSIHRLKKNGGLGNALNQGLKICRNELVARMDADDVSMPERCKKQLLRFHEKSELVILGTQIKEFIGDTTNIVSIRNVPCNYIDIQRFARRRSPFNHPTVMYKKSVIENMGGYPTLNRKEDLELFINAVYNGVYSENLEDALLFYRTSEENQKRRRTWINCKEYIQVMYGFYRKGYLGFIDMLYVAVGQMVMHIAPTKMINYLSRRFLRS